MGNIVKLVFHAVSTGSGFSKLYGEVKGLTSSMPGLTKATMILGQAFGTTGAAVGRMATMLMQGGIWGAAAEGARLLIEKFGLFGDKTEDAKEKLDKLEESTRKFYETINAGAQKSIAKIDADTKKRNEQLDITNRMIKAELQLQKARAIARRDTKGAEAIDLRMEQNDNATAMDKAVGTERDAASKVKVAEAGLNAAQKEERKANAELAKAEAALASASKPVTMTVQSPTVGAFELTQKRDTTQYRLAVESARKRLELAEQATDVAKKSVEAEREKWQQAKAGVKALKAEQEAADAVAAAKRMAELKEKASADAKALKDARNAADEEIRKHNEEVEKKRKERELAALREEVRTRNELRKKDLQKDIEANRQRAASLERSLGDAMERVRETHDILGNAENMDQAGDVSEKRRDILNNSRFATGAIDLIDKGKIHRSANGEWVADGRLSNMNQAILERLNAEENKKRVENEKDKVVDKLDELIRKIEQMSAL